MFMSLFIFLVPYVGSFSFYLWHKVWDNCRITSLSGDSNNSNHHSNSAGPAVCPSHPQPGSQRLELLSLVSAIAGFLWLDKAFFFLVPSDCLYPRACYAKHFPGHCAPSLKGLQGLWSQF